MADHDEDLTAPALTITVYRVNPETGEETVIKPRRLVRAKEPLIHSTWPMCACPRCLKTHN